MDAILQTLITGTYGLVAYGTVFGILVACGLGVPLPEDISLILGGYLAHKGAADLPTMMLVGFLGILVGDSLIYAAGRRLGTRVGTGNGSGFFARIITPEKRARVEQLFARHGRKVVMVARFMPGVRAVTYFTAGSVRMSYWSFIFWDGLAALASAPVFVYLGFRFGGQLDWLTEKMKEGQLVVFGGVAVLVGAWWLFKRLRRSRQAEASVSSAQGQVAGEEDSLGQRIAVPGPREGVAPGPQAPRVFSKADMVGPPPAS